MKRRDELSGMAEECEERNEGGGRGVVGGWG